LYKATDFYAPHAEGALLWSDPSVGIVWPEVGTMMQLAAKDSAAPELASIKSFAA
jgi:dTDP-4-dehydrorhamnose 3,5-epimerase